MISTENEKIIKNIRFNLNKYLDENPNIKSLVIGVSGGIDSAICCALAEPVCKLRKIRLIGWSLPSISNSTGEQERADMIGESFCDIYEKHDITQIFYYLRSECDLGLSQSKDSKIRHGNLKARIRMIQLYNLAHFFDGLVLSTDNFTEYLLGFWTICGDEGDVAPIRDLWKTEVYGISNYMVVMDPTLTPMQRTGLQECIDAKPTDGLGITDSDLDQILPTFHGNHFDGYRIVDEILIEYLEKKNISLESNPIILRHLRTEFKRKRPIKLIAK